MLFNIIGFVAQVAGVLMLAIMIYAIARGQS